MHLPPHTSIISFARSQHYAADPAMSKAQMSDPEDFACFYRGVKSTNVRSILKICGFFGELCFLSQLFQLCLLHCLYRSEVGRKCNPCRSNQAISCATCTYLPRVENHKICQKLKILIANRWGENETGVVPIKQSNSCAHY